MPHCYSAVAWQKRVERALSRGFVLPKPRGQRYIQVDAELHGAVKAAYQSLRYHRRHDSLTGTSHHYGRLAGLFAHESGKISDAEFKMSTRTHKVAGLLKHNVSKLQWQRVGEVGANGRDLVYDMDPWAGKVPIVERVALSREEVGDVWAGWSARHEQESSDRAAGSCEGRADGARNARPEAMCVLMDVLVNEAFRVLASDVKAEIACIESGIDAPVDGGECALLTCDVSPPSCGEEEHDYQDDHELRGYPERLRAHSELSLRCVREWESIEYLIRAEAGELASCIECDGEEWWSETLQVAERLQSFACAFGETRTYLDSEQVVEAVRSQFVQEDEKDVVGIEALEVLTKTGQVGDTIHAGALTLLFGLLHVSAGVGGSSDDGDGRNSSDVDAGSCADDDEGEGDRRSCGSAELRHDGFHGHYPSDSEGG